MPASPYFSAGGANHDFLNPRAFADVSAAAAQARVEAQAGKDAATLEAEREAQIESMAEYIMWASAQWGEPNEAARTRAREIIDAFTYI